MVSGTNETKSIMLSVIDTVASLAVIIPGTDPLALAFLAFLRDAAMRCCIGAYDTIVDVGRHL